MEISHSHDSIHLGQIIAFDPRSMMPRIGRKLAKLTRTVFTDEKKENRLIIVANYANIFVMLSRNYFESKREFNKTILILNCACLLLRLFYIFVCFFLTLCAAFVMLKRRRFNSAKFFFFFLLFL